MVYCMYTACDAALQPTHPVLCCWAVPRRNRHFRRPLCTWPMRRHSVTSPPVALTASCADSISWFSAPARYRYYYYYYLFYFFLFFRPSVDILLLLLRLLTWLIILLSVFRYIIIVIVITWLRWTFPELNAKQTTWQKREVKRFFGVCINFCVMNFRHGAIFCDLVY